MSIFVPRGGVHFRHKTGAGIADISMIQRSRNMLANVCMKIPYKDYEISISCDDSSGCAADLTRSDIRVYKNDKDVTKEVMLVSHVYADAEALRRAMDRIDALEVMRAAAKVQ